MSNTDAWCTVWALWAPRGRLDLENWTDSLPSDSLLFFFPCSLWIRRVLTSVLLWWITQTLPWWAPGTMLTAHASTICQFASTMQVRYSSLCLREPLYHKDLIWNEFAADVISNIHCTVVPMPTWDDTFENVIKAFFFPAVIVFEFFVTFQPQTLHWMMWNVQKHIWASDKAEINPPVSMNWSDGEYVDINLTLF